MPEIMKGIAMDTILITGASGMLGRSLVEQLAQKDEYHIVALISGRRRVSFSPQVQTVICDLTSKFDREQMIECIQPDILCHLAWNMEFPDFKNSAINLKWLEISLSLMEKFVECGGKQLLFAGSCMEDDGFTGMLTDQKIMVQTSLYGECKRAYVNVASNYCKSKGVRFVSAKYFTLYGEYDSHDYGAVPYAIRGFMTGEPVVCKAPNSIRDYVYVKDAALATLRLLESDYYGVVNISSGLPKTMRSVFTAVAELIGREDLLSFENEDKCEAIFVGDNHLLRERIGFNAFTPFEEGLAATIQWWKGVVDQL